MTSEDDGKTSVDMTQDEEEESKTFSGRVSDFPEDFRVLDRQYDTILQLQSSLGIMMNRLQLLRGERVPEINKNGLVAEIKAEITAVSNFARKMEVEFGATQSKKSFSDFYVMIVDSVEIARLRGADESFLSLLQRIRGVFFRAAIRNKKLIQELQSEFDSFLRDTSLEDASFSYDWMETDPREHEESMTQDRTSSLWWMLNAAVDMIEGDEVLISVVLNLRDTFLLLCKRNFETIQDLQLAFDLDVFDL